MKHAPAILTALLITAVIGFGIMVIGVSALTNTNTVAIQNSPGTGATNNSSSSTSSDPAAQAAALPTNVQQLQQEVTSLQSQLDQANQAAQQYETILMALQQRGVIRIDSNGNIYLPRGESEFH